MDAHLQQTSELLERTSAMAKIGGWELDMATMQVTYTTEAIRIHEFDIPYVPPTLSEGNKFYPPKAWPIIEAAVQAAIEHGKAYDLESPFITAKGRHIWVRVQGNAVRENGKTVKLRGTIQDITERKQIEEKLKFSEKRSLAYLENSPACTKILDLDFNLQYMSKAGVEGLNIDNIEDYYGKPYPFSFYPESFKKEMRGNLVRAKETGETITQEAPVVDVDGNEIWFHSTIVPVNDDQCEIDYLLVVSIDTTQRKQAEEALENALAEKSLSEALLHASEAQTRAMLDQAPMGIALIDSLSGQLYEINQRFAKIVGRSREDLLTLDWMTITHPEDIQPDLDNMARLNAGEISGFNMQKRYIHSDTSIVWVSLTVAPIKVADKNRPRHLAMVEDITEKKQAEVELEKQRTTFKALFESIPDATVLVDQNRRIISINKAFTDIFGYTLDELLGKPTSVFYESKDEFLRQGRLRFNLSLEEATEPYIVTYRRKDGSLFPGETVGTKVVTPTGEVIGFLGLMRDVSERLIQEEALRQTHKMEAIGILSGGIAHEFNNLLAIVSGNIDIVQHKQQTGINTEGNIGNIKETVRRAKSLVEQILTFSRQNRHNLSVLDLSAVIADTLKLLRATIPATVDIIINDDSQSVFVNADATQLQQTLINLCTNAIHAMNEQGQLTIHLGKVALESSDLPPRIEGQPGCYATLSVSDTGCGIEQANIGRIFEPFFTTKEVGDGTGMGLSVIHGIVEQHKGFMTVDSTPGRGTTFNVFLPAIETGQPEIRVDSDDSLPTGTERVLFVDDEECVAETCCELLEYQGYTVASTTNGGEALELFKKTPTEFDLVFTDQTMPGMTGVELAKELLKIRPDIPIILCSGYAAKVSEDVAKGIGIREFCMKPMDIKQLATIARKVLDENDSSS